MLPAEELFVYVYVLIHDLILAGVIQVPRRPGPPACTDAELLTITQIRHLLGRRSEAAFLAEVARDWGHLFPVLPHQSEANRRTAGCGAHSRSSGSPWRPGCRRMTASRPLPARCRSSIRPGSAARTAGPGRATTWPPGSAATPPTPSGSTASASP